MEIKNFRIEGLKELEDFMVKEFPAAISRRVILSGMRKAAKPTKEIAKSLVRKRSHSLEKSIDFKTLPQKKSLRAGHFASLMMGIAGGGKAGTDAFLTHASYYKRKTTLGKVLRGRIRHGHLVEFGFKHTSGKQVKARPFLRPAFDQGAPVFASQFSSIMKQRITAAVKRKRRGGKKGSKR